MEPMIQAIFQKQLEKFLVRQLNVGTREFELWN